MDAKRPMSPLQKKALYYLDDKLARGHTRRITIHNSEIAEAIGSNKRRIVEVMWGLERRGWVRKIPQRAAHGGAAANAYDVMPANPRKRQMIEAVADTIGHNPFDVLGYCTASSLGVSLLGEEHFFDLSMGEYERRIGYKRQDESDWAGRFIDAAKEVGLDIHIGIEHW